MGRFLEEAMAAGRLAAEERRRLVPEEKLEARLAGAEGVPPFREAIGGGGARPEVIAEVKRASPSAGEIRKGASVAGTAEAYERAGAAAVSVLTSGFGFGGRLEDLSEARSGCGLPLLCKDFVSLPYQVMEARSLGASAVLLIADALGQARIEELARRARELEMEALVEAHTRQALERALEAGATVIGINNRDLDTLTVDVGTTERLVGLVPEGTAVVSESGIRTREDVERIGALGVDAVLIGEALMRAPDPGARLVEMLDAGNGSGLREGSDP